MASICLGLNVLKHYVKCQYHFLPYETIHHVYINGQPIYPVAPSFQTCQSQDWCSVCMSQAHQDDISHDETHNGSNLIDILLYHLFGGF